jgi:hypothetical protein
VDVGGSSHDLGIVKDFRAHDLLADFVPALARPSISWVHLEPGQELAAHKHPTKSMIIVAEGAGRVKGEVTGTIQAGDVVAVPEGAVHGFVGEEPAGFWALSLQFEGDGLYEDPASPRVQFEGPGTVAQVIEENQRQMEAFGRSALVELARLCASTDRADLRSRLLDHLQPWSEEFQHMIAQRAAAERDPTLLLLARDHLETELGHNQLLAQSRRGRVSGEWDPVVAAVAAWFVDRMGAASTVERTVLAHLVLEGSGLVFHQAAHQAFPDSGYFAQHSEADEEHLRMGYQALAQRADWTLDQVSEVLDQGWRMMTLLGDRIAAQVQGTLR